MNSIDVFSMYRVWSSAVFALLIIVSSLSWSQAATVDRVVDGDTFVLSTGEKVRLIGIDTPESRNPDKPVEYFSEEARGYLQHLISGRDIRLEYGEERTDKYGHLLFYVWVRDTLVNLEMVKQGYAMAFLRFPHSRETEFLKAEIAARRAAIGMWASPRSAQPGIDDLSTKDVENMLDEAGEQLPPPQPWTSPTPSSTQVDSDETVYINKNDSKYHRGSCSYLSRSKIAIARKDAIARGYQPCSRCDP